MGSDTLTTLVKGTQGSQQDLGALVKALIHAAEPLEGKFNGPGKQAFDQFKAHTDQIANNLDSALAAIIGGQAGMNTSFIQGQDDFLQNSKSAQGGADFSSASFGSSKV